MTFPYVNMIYIFGAMSSVSLVVWCFDCLLASCREVLFAHIICRAVLNKVVIHTRGVDQGRMAASNVYFRCSAVYQTLNSPSRRTSGTLHPDIPTVQPPLCCGLVHCPLPHPHPPLWHAAATTAARLPPHDHQRQRPAALHLGAFAPPRRPSPIVHPFLHHLQSCMLGRQPCACRPP